MQAAVFLAAICILTSAAVISPMRAQAAVQPQINGHSLIAENENYALYMNEEYLSIIVLDKETYGIGGEQ